MQYIGNNHDAFCCNNHSALFSILPNPSANTVAVYAFAYDEHRVVLYLQWYTIHNYCNGTGITTIDDVSILLK